MRNSSVPLWVLRVIWLLQPLAFVGVISDATKSLSSTGALVIGVGVWTAWAVGLLATFVPSSVSLTVGRLLAPAAVAVAAVAAGGSAVSGGKAAVAGGAAAVAVLVWFSGEIGAAFAQGSAYGNEQRFPLKAPVPYAIPMALSWLLLASSAIFGVVLIANHTAILGALLVVVAAVVGWFVGPRFHQLSRRWLVVLPVGVVVHDPMMLLENALFRTSELAAIHLAPVGTEAADLTGGTAGVAVEIVLREMDTITKAAGRDKPEGTALHVLSVLIAPSRPGRALAAAAARRLPVG